MMTNSKLYEMIIGQVNEGNESIREQLKTQISERADQAQTLAQRLAEKQSREFSELLTVINEKLDNIKADMMQDIHEKIANLIYENGENFEKQMQLIKRENENLMREVNDKIDDLRNELIERMNDDLNKNLSSFKALSDGISNIQKDSAVIMETLQLILTNMMLDKVNVEGTVKDYAEVDQHEIIREFHW
ncbi:MAG: hypothetical protein IKK91_00195 [Ruminococcus sp.]|nr:hypothetical protein [Ruminococcus sp.]